MSERPQSPPPGRRVRPDNRGSDARAQNRDAKAVLLSAALAVFSRRGYRVATVDEIAEEAGYSKGAVYWHFGSKDGLFSALLDEYLEQPVLEMVGLLRSAAPEKDMSVELTRVLAALLERDAAYLLLEGEYALAAARDPQLAARHAEREHRLRAAIAGALATRVERLGAPGRVAEAADQMAATILVLVAGVTQKHLIDPGGFPARLVGDTIALVYRGLVARAGEEDAGAARDR